MSDEIRSADIQRKTTETEVLLQIGLDGTGRHQIDTEIPFSVICSLCLRCTACVT